MIAGSGDNSLTKLESKLKAYREGRIDPVTKAYWEMHYQFNLKLATENTQPGDIILDIGCGSGRIMIDLAKIRRRCVGLDPLYEVSLLRAQKNARDKNADISLVWSFSECLPFKSEIFDMVLLFSTLQHVRDHETTLNEARRVLKERGLLLMSVPTARNISTLFRRAKKPDHFTATFDLRELKIVLDKHGFNLLEVQGCGFFPPFAHRAFIVMQRILGSNAIRKSLGLMDNLAGQFPSSASSVILLCGVAK